MAKKVTKKESKQVEIILELEKETSNTVRYKEVTEEGKPPIMRNLYLQKWFAGDAERVKVIVELE